MKRWYCAATLAVATTSMTGTPPATAAASLQRLAVKDAVRPLAAPSTEFAPRHVAMTPDGRYVVLTVRTQAPVNASTALAPATYVYDRTTRRLDLVSVSTKGARGGLSGAAQTDIVDTGSISADGRYVVFVSGAPNLVPGDGNDLPDVFLRDRVKRTTVRVSVDARGREIPRPAKNDERLAAGPMYDAAISRDGSRVLFKSAYDLLGDGGTGKTLYSWTRTTKKLVAVDRVPDGKAGADSTAGGQAAMSNDGRYVVFSTAAKLVAADTDSLTDVYRRDVVTGQTLLVTDAAMDGTVDPQQGNVALDQPQYQDATVDRGGRWVAVRAKDAVYPELHDLIREQVAVRDLGSGVRKVVADREVLAVVYPTAVELFADPVIADDASAVVYTEIAPPDTVDPGHADADLRLAKEMATVYRAPLSGDPVALTPNPATVCGDGSCYTVDPGSVRHFGTSSAPASGTGPQDVPVLAVGAGARTVLIVTGVPFTADDPDDASDPTTTPADAADLYLWRG